MKKNLVGAVALFGWFKFIVPAVAAATLWNGIGMAATLTLILTALLYYVQEENV